MVVLDENDRFAHDILIVFGNGMLIENPHSSLRVDLHVRYFLFGEPGLTTIISLNVRIQIKKYHSTFLSISKVQYCMYYTYPD